MNRTTFLLLTGICLSLSCTSDHSAVNTSAARPNILWVSVEDISPRLGCYGDTVARTPELDRLARDGVRYTNAFTTAGVCAPSRSAIITGMYQPSIGTHHMRTTHEAENLPTPYFAVPPPEVKAFSEYLRAAGYYCTNNVKTDYQFGTPLTAWDETSQEAHWRNRDPGQPFFAIFNFTTTHESQVWPKENQKLTTDPQTVAVPPYYPDTPAVREDLARHYDNIARVDQQIGEVLSQLEEDGLAEETVVFFWSDHGDGLPRAKRWLYDSGLKVPLIIRWSGELTPGSVDDQLVSFVDLAPTVLSVAGLEVPDHIQGRAFLGPQTGQPREYIFGARDRIDEAYDHVRAVRDKRFKYIRNFFPDKPYILPVPYRNRGITMQEILRLDASGGLEGPQLLWAQKSRFPEELYDTEADPDEIVNLIDDPSRQDVAARLRAELDHWMIEIGDLGSVPEAEMVEKMWPGHVQPVTDKPILNPYGGTSDSSIEVSIICSTHGASLAYTFDTGEKPHWLLYSGPIEIASTSTLRVKAIRYGYADSEEVAVPYAINP